MDMKQLRERANLRTIDVAYHLGIAESTVRNWEKGRTIPKLRIDQFANLTEIYNCTFEDLNQAFQKSLNNSQSQLSS